MTDKSKRNPDSRQNDGSYTGAKAQIQKPIGVMNVLNKLGILGANWLGLSSSETGGRIVLRKIRIKDRIISRQNIMSEKSCGGITLNMARTLSMSPPEPVNWSHWNRFAEKRQVLKNKLDDLAAPMRLFLDPKESQIVAIQHIWKKALSVWYECSCSIKTRAGISRWSRCIRWESIELATLVKYSNDSTCFAVDDWTLNHMTNLPSLWKCKQVPAISIDAWKIASCGTTW